MRKKQPASHEQAAVDNQYISIGSGSYFSKEQIGEIAKGLEMMMLTLYGWLDRSPAGSDVALPEGFLDRLKQ
ncbi:hypothetical protein ACS0TY_023055 [Phlomoides rotata]